MALQTWLGFLVAAWVISLSPGAGAVASMASGLQHGFWRGYWMALGLQLGLILQIALVAAGVGALLAASEQAFNAIKWFGVGYLLWLAYKQWQAVPAALVAVTEQPSARPLNLLLRGFLVNSSNPKAIVFMLAVLPQFIDPQAPLTEQYLILGVTMVTVDLIVMAGYTGLASRVLRLLRTPGQQRRLNRIFAGLFVLAAGLLGLLRRATP